METMVLDKVSSPGRPTPRNGLGSYTDAENGTNDRSARSQPLQASASVPGSIVLPNHRVLSLVRLMRLEQQVAQLLSVRNVSVSVAPQGHVTVTVPPAAEGRVRSFLTLTGELSEN